MSENKLRFIIINVVDPFTSLHEADRDLDELKSLVQTFGGGTIVRVIQRRMKPDPHTYIGSGKAQEVAEIVKQEKIDVIVVNAIVKPGQLFNLEKIAWESNHNIKVWDRVDLILHIFDKHAHTAEAKLQIELARMRHMGPRIYGMGMVLSRQGGGIGTRGIGETNTELMKRHWRKAMKEVQDKLKKLTADRQRQIEQRRQKGFQTISIVGYTNAGKSTLFNRLTGKNKLAADVLFATLDSSVGKLYLPNAHQQLLVSDTIGFIQNLPAKLVDAFKSTLLESLSADLLLHVIDISDHLIHEKIDIVEGVLLDLGIQEKNKIYVFNKIDHPTTWSIEELKDHYKQYSPHFISARTGEGIPELIQSIEQVFSRTSSLRE